MKPLPVSTAAFLLSGITPIDGFVPVSPSVLTPLHQQYKVDGCKIITLTEQNIALQTSSPKVTARQTALASSNNAKNEGPGIVAAIFGIGVLFFFAVSAFVPLLEVTSTSPTANVGLGHSVVTRQDNGGSLKNYESKFDKLSKARIQEKLSNLPVFYLSNDGKVNERIYFSFTEADAASKDLGATVKVTTLDQILYQLILKQGKIKSSSTPSDIKQAIETSSEAAYSLVPSAAALKDAQDTGTTLKENDIPLFVVERLAFAGNGNEGPQIPLFLEKADAITSYKRLRESGGNKLPEEPVIRTTSLMDVLDSMERGTRPGVSQLTFYGNAGDVLTADEMSQ